MSDNLRIPGSADEHADQVIAVTDEVRFERLDAEYAQLAQRR